jgi:CelD/BcsL family acetyltransferase involved in cellulose biosynthesis
MAVYKIDPIKDERWGEFLQQHPAASIFHTPGWLEALRRTYGYEAIAFTTSPPGHSLTNGSPFCRITSWLSGRRLVSLPFSDHCTPLVESSEQVVELLAALQESIKRENWKYVEIRSAGLQLPDSAAPGQSKVFVMHRLDLRSSQDEIFRRFHKDCVQRTIRRAEKANLTYEAGTSEKLLAKFYHLLLATRRKHGLPPQPEAWFRNLIACLKSQVTIHVASKDDHPIASILTLRHKRVLVYKYGCSDPGASRLGGTQLLLWKAIQSAKNDELFEFDLGRSDCDNAGLIRFKDRWGTRRSALTYFQFPLKSCQIGSTATQGPLVKYLFAHVPDSVLVAAGRMLYKHVG